MTLDKSQRISGHLALKIKSLQQQFEKEHRIKISFIKASELLSMRKGTVTIRGKRKLKIEIEEI